MCDEVRRVANHALFGQMAWPIPNHEAGWQMRYTRPIPPKPSLMVAAGEMDAYARLIQMSARDRNRVVSSIRKAMRMDAK